jgi:hypothetical protein
VWPHSRVILEGNSRHLWPFHDTLILPCQLIERRPAMPQPLTRLAYAVLELALTDLTGRAYIFHCRNRKDASRKRMQLQDDASRWVAGRSTQPFSFEWTCSVLNLDSDAVRAWTASLTDGSVRVVRSPAVTAFARTPEDRPYVRQAT